MVMRTQPVQGVLVQSNLRSMIICDARTGSNLLGFSLDKHGGIRYGDEILCESVQCIPPILREFAKKYVNLDKAVRLGQEKRALIAKPEYLDYAFEHFNLFKLLYYHIDIKNLELIRYIKEFDGKIIHLKRKSYLDKCISWFIAQRDDGFLYRNRPPRKKPIEIDLQKLKFYLDRMIFQEQFWDTTLKDKRVKVVYYHELVDEWRTTIESCQKYLGVPAKVMTKRTCQAISCPNIELVKNKKEVLEFMQDYADYI